MKQLTPAQTEYEAAVEKLREFCDTHTDLLPIIIDAEYPIRVQLVPDADQVSLFGDENVDENGEVNDMTISVGLSTYVTSTLRFRMDSKLLKKLMKLAENVGRLYYHAFKAEHGPRLTPKRPIWKEEDGLTVCCCPKCGKLVVCLDGTTANFCRECGQALDWTPEPEPPEEVAQAEEQIGMGASAEELEGDELLPDAVDVVLETGQVSVSILQRRLKLGYARAALIVDEMEAKGIVGPFQGSTPRAVLITKEQWAAMKSGQTQPTQAQQPGKPMEM